MYGWNTLKKTIDITPTKVECPVLGCQERVERQRKRFLKESRFICQKHGICISPSTFEYPNEQCNMLWATEEDLRLWNCIKAKGVKRESRTARDNSEDALTWNVFRYLELSHTIGDFIDFVASERISHNPRVVYWSFCQATQRPFQPLLDAASAFGENIARRSEPDVIIDDEKVLMFVESKLSAGNRTKPRDPQNPKRYVTGGESWFSKAFSAEATFAEIAVEQRLYELMRLWLLGSWIAARDGRKFLLVNVVREGARSEATIEARFNAFVQNVPERRFVRLTWEGIVSEVIQSSERTPDSERLDAYMREKCMGYSSIRKGTQGKLRRAFSL